MFNSTIISEFLNNQAYSNFDKLTYLGEFFYRTEYIALGIFFLAGIIIGMQRVSTPYGKVMILSQKPYLALFIVGVLILVTRAVSLQYAPFFDYWIANIFDYWIANISEKLQNFNLEMFK